MRSTPFILRRQFMLAASASVVGSMVSANCEVRAHFADALPAANQYIPGKDHRLIVHSVKTGELETPLDLLREHRLTPKALLFVRNNQALSGTLSIEPAQDPNWPIRLSGLVDKAISVTVGDLEKLPQRDFEMVLQCSGNSRSRFESSQKAEGVPWQHGAMGNVVFRGVRLHDLLESRGVKVDSKARFIAAEGMDAPVMAGTADFEHSLPLNVALERTILAISLNGEPLPKVHGGPVRLVTPGYYATMNVKWLGAIRLEANESSNYHHVGRYRTPLRLIPPGSPFVSTLDNSEPNWDMRIKSVIFAPLAGARHKGKLEVRGVAWNDGLTRIESVLVSTNGGNQWHRAPLESPSSPFAWHHWKLDLELPPGTHTIQSRAIDVKGRAQPLDGALGWNPAGYAWNGVDSVTVTVG